MMMYDHDPDVVRWGLHNLIDVCTISNGGSPGSITRFETDESIVGLVTEGYNANYAENDAVIARALQEELSRIAAAEASGCHNPGQESILAQNWLGDPGRSLGSEHDNGGNVTDDRGKNEINSDYCKEKVADESSENKCEQNDEILISISSSNDGERAPNREEPSYLLDIADECALDGEVGKRLNQMMPVPHVPKINGEFPTEDEEISNHQRLLERLKVYDLVENKVQGDGNCQFRALSDQLYRSPDHHKFVREQVVNQLKYHPEMYDGYVPMAYADYLKKMSKSGEWGDHVTLQAAADSYGVKIFVITSFKDTCYIEILPHLQKSERVICLSFWAEVHYNSIYPEGELLQFETKKKKKWWLLGS